MTVQQNLGLEKRTDSTGPVECLGQTFPSDKARREHYIALLAAKLKDPEYRRHPGFPRGSDEEILRLSDPPYYTACPNPFLVEFVREFGKPFVTSDGYRREPQAVDVSEGKYDWLYRAHAYHTKVPHLAIVPSILHYTNTGDLVLDGFCGSGMTGLAAQWCAEAPPEYRRRVESDLRTLGHAPPDWGARRVILNDLGPAATFIAAGYNLPFDTQRLEREAKRIVREIENELGWMYETLHSDGKTKGHINYTVWSEVFSCPECASGVNFVEEAVDEETSKTKSEFPCPKCGTVLTKDNLERSFETLLDPATRKSWKRIRLEPLLVNYTVAGRTLDKKPDRSDEEVLRRVAQLPFPVEVPTGAFPIDQMYHGSRLAPKGFTHVHHMFLARSAQVLAAMWRKAIAVEDAAVRRMLLFAIEQTISTGSVLNRYRPGSSFGNGPLRGVYYVSSQIAEASVLVLMDGIMRRLERGFGAASVARSGQAIISTGDCAALGLPTHSVDYIFTDPPFGENIYYADLNFLVEAWYGVLTRADNEAIVDRAKKKGVGEYQDLMRRCFEEYYRVLKPGRWMTVVFSNSSNGIWRAIQEGMGTAGFVVADVRTLDKKQGSYRQVTSSAVKQDLVISAYKPTEALAQRFSLGTASGDAVWAFVNEHLNNVPVFVGSTGGAEIISERTPQMLHDRMVAFFVQHRVAVPLGSQEFLAGLDSRYPKRDGMYFLAGQVSQYDRKRTSVAELRQLELFVSDESSATQWVRQQLHRKPQTFQELQPQFMQQLQAWAKHEKTIELKELLALNFFRYEDDGPVPSQIHSYLSTNFKDLRNLGKDDPALKAKASDRWYVPDPSREGDLEKLRLRTLMKEFDDYRTSKSRKLKQFRTEAVRAGFKQCYDQQDYRTIVDVAAKLPEQVIQEDEKLLMYYDVASMRLGEE